MTNEEVAKDLIRQFGENVYDFDEPYGMLTLSTRREQIISMIEYLRDHPLYQINFLTTLCGIHYPDDPEPARKFCVVYQLHSLVNNFRIRIKVFLAENDLHMPTLTNIYQSANWMERETYDFFGIIFDGHPKLIRILNMEDMDYFPMRKQYPLEDPTREDKIDALFGR
ncbi:NADH-quinone oxidoreductase subunit C [Larkinella arboricola]|uniref:NADH-quinone oxidoreductase subunit C n=1 Tax=Larkinella arboricola TaxID=643671 RepID=A0A327WYA3_LARAB|nr:NADH-quinone oxidoreductase subunit C [Larkinella arboricola]RAJ97716.1 NADH-quinone oxidoreductase subunit C [Larkinella arboricola]